MVYINMLFEDGKTGVFVTSVQPSWGLKFKAVFKIDKVLPYYLSYHEAKKTLEIPFYQSHFVSLVFQDLTQRHPDEMFLKTFLSMFSIHFHYGVSSFGILQPFYIS